jgi:hypothetical protein
VFEGDNCDRRCINDAWSLEYSDVMCWRESKAEQDASL